MSQISDFIDGQLVCSSRSRRSDLQMWRMIVGRILECGVWLLDTTASWNEQRASRDTLIDDQQIMRKKCSLKNTKLSI